jgi:hypothetical protein
MSSVAKWKYITFRIGRNSPAKFSAMLTLRSTEDMRPLEYDAKERLPGNGSFGWSLSIWRDGLIGETHGLYG